MNLNDFSKWLQYNRVKNLRGSEYFPYPLYIYTHICVYIYIYIYIYLSSIYLSIHTYIHTYIYIHIHIYIYIYMVIPHTALLSHSKLPQGKFLHRDSPSCVVNAQLFWAK